VGMVQAEDEDVVIVDALEEGIKIAILSTNFQGSTWLSLENANELKKELIKAIRAYKKQEEA
jgi:hypothetical protein